MILSFRPQIYDESETDQILNAKYFVWKNYTLGKWGTRKAFNQNSLMHFFNGDRHIVHWLGPYVGQLVTRRSDHYYFHLQCQNDQVDLGQLLDGNRWFLIFDHYHFWNTGSGSNNHACNIIKVWTKREILSIFCLEDFDIFKILFSRPLPVNVVFKDIFSIWNFVFAPDNGLKPRYWRFLLGKVT